MKSAEEFADFYESKMIPELQAIEARRLTVVRRRQIFITFLTVVLLAAGFWIWHKQYSYWFFVLAAVSVSLLSSLLFNKFFNDPSVGIDYKRLLTAKITDFLTAGSVSQTEEYTYINFRKSKLFLQQAEHFKAENTVRGTMGGRPFLRTFLNVGYQREANSRTKWINIFRGFFFEISFSNKFEGRTVIVPNYWEQNLKVMAERMKKHDFLHGKGVRIRDKEFNNYFAVYGTQPLEALNVISGEVAEVLTEFIRMSRIKPSLAFTENRMYLALEISDELNNYSPGSSVLNYKKAERIYEALDSIFSLMIELNNAYAPEPKA